MLSLFDVVYQALYLAEHLIYYSQRDTNLLFVLTEKRAHVGETIMAKLVQHRPPLLLYQYDWLLLRRFGPFCIWRLLEFL